MAGLAIMAILNESEALQPTSPIRVKGSLYWINDALSLPASSKRTRFECQSVSTCTKLIWIFTQVYARVLDNGYGYPMGQCVTDF